MRRVTNMPISLPQGTPPRHLAMRALPADRRPQRGPAGRAVGGWLPKITAKCFERYGFHTADIITNWATVAGPELAALAVPERISWPRAKPGSAITGAHEPQPAARRGGPRSGLRGGPKPGERAADGATLVLRTDPAHALDVEYRAVEIADKLNRYFGYRAIAQVKVRQGPIDTSEVPARPKVPAKPTRAMAAAANGAAQSAVSASATRSATPSHDLASALASLAGAISAERSGR